MAGQLSKPEKGDTIATMKTNRGDIKIKLFPEQCPKTVENFITHAKNGYYEGIIFHRVIKDFMIQGGDPTGTGRGGESIWGGSFEDEFDTDLHNLRGALSMANAGPDTNGSQFFIVQAGIVDGNLMGQMEMIGEKMFPNDCIDNYKKVGGTPWLDFKHTVFGQVFDGMDVVDDIASTRVDMLDKPFDDVVIEKIEISNL
jgi:peptidyl-prolyl cis-trans isomerase B (cyclophilin B)